MEIKVENKVENKSLKELQDEYYAARRKKQSDYEELRAIVVPELVNKAVALNKAITEFHKEAYEELGTLYELLIEYSERHAKGVGNFTPDTGNMRIKYSRQGVGSFDERAKIAESYIKDFVSEKFKNDKDAQELIISLLDKKNDEFDTNLIQKLYKMENKFQDEKWKKGIELFKESYTYNFSKDYILFQQRDSKGKWQTVNLNFSAI